MGYIMLGMAILILDIMTKLVAELNLKALDTVPIIKGVFHFTYVENRGIAFGMFSDARLLFIIISIAVLAALAVLYGKTRVRTRWLRFGTALIYGGAIGNLMERMAKGYVVDFFDFRLIHFPVFNVADIAVCVGAVLLMIHFIINEREAQKTMGEGQGKQSDTGENLERESAASRRED